MNTSHLTALSLTFIIYIVLAAACFGWGKATASLLGMNEQGSGLSTAFIWVGWAFILFILQLLHLFLPLTAFVFIPVLALGVVFAIPGIVSAYRRRSSSHSRGDWALILIISIVFLAIAVWIASRAMLFPTVYDTGLYHLNKIRWINSYPVIPGLGNLHGRLAFNQSFFAYAAALNFFPYFLRGRSIANSFLFLLTLATFIELLRPVFRRPSLLQEAHPFEYVSVILTFPVLLFLAVTSPGLASPSPDLASTLMQLTMFVVLVQGLGKWQRGKTDQDKRAVFLALMATTAVTIKLSNLAFSAIILGFLFFYFYANRTRTRRLGAGLLVVSGTILVVWVLHSYILSGTPFYPSTIGRLPFEWSVPTENIDNEAKWIYSWARQPGEDPNVVLSSWGWFEPWLEKHTYKLLLLLGSFFFLIMLVILNLRSRNRLRISEWAILTPSIIGLVYWFLLAPDPRFAGALFFTTLISVLLLLLTLVQDLIKGRVYLVATIGALVTICLFLIVYRTGKSWDIKSLSVSGWHHLKSAELEEKVTASGLTVYVPTSSNQAWNSPLPSTPYFNDQLKLRNPENMGFGFSVLPNEE